MAIADTIDFTSDGSIEVRVEDDVLYVTLSGRLAPADLSRVADEAVTRVDSFTDTFAVITDISTFRPTTLDAVASFEPAQRAFARADVSEIVRVVGPQTEPAVETTFRRASGTAGYDAVSVDSVAAAQQLLGE